MQPHLREHNRYIRVCFGSELVVSKTSILVQESCRVTGTEEDGAITEMMQKEIPITS